MNNTETTATATLETLTRKFLGCFLSDNPAGHSDEFMHALAAETAATALAALEANE